MPAQQGTVLNTDGQWVTPSQSPLLTASCTFTQALVNVGSMFAKEVQGRVCTEVDARLANSTDKMVDTVHQLVGLYGEVGVPTDKLIFRLPGVSG